MKRLSVILVSFLLYLPLSAQFKGTVYVDTDQSGLFNKGDKPLAGVMVIQSPNQKIPDRKTKCVIKTHINIKQNVIFGAKLKPV